MKLSVLAAILIGTTGIFAQNSAEKVLDNIVKEYKTQMPVKMDLSVFDSKGTKLSNASLLIDNEKYRGRMGTITYISDGKSLWINNKQAKQTTINSVDDGGNEMFNVLKYISNYKQNYTAKLISDKNDMITIELAPKKKAEFEKLTVIVNKLTNRIAEIVVLLNKTSYTLKIVSFIPYTKVTKETFQYNESEFPNTETVDLR